MMNKIEYSVYILVSLATLASCQRMPDTIDQQAREQISLIPEVTTKGTSVTTANISDFTAFGYTQGRADWADIVTLATSNLMYNNKYTKTGNSWVGAIKTPWPDNEFKRYSFFAYSPSGSAANKISVLTNSSTMGYQRLSYETLTDVSKQVDLVLASRLNQTPAKEVPLSFSHALSRVGFCVYAEKPGVVVKSISINGVKYRGEIEVRSGAPWTNVSPIKANFTAAIGSSEISTDVNNPTMLTGSSGQNYFMLLPQDLTGNTDNTICITVVTNKAGRDRSQSYTITQNYQQGKSLLYKLLIPDGVDLVVDYTVTDWGTNSIPTDIKATYLNVSVLSEIAPVTFFYATDYTGAITATELGSTGKLAISQNASNKSFTVNGVIGSNCKVKVTAGNLSKIVDVTVPLSVAPTQQTGIPYNGGTYAITLNSVYPWSASTNVPGITITPSSGAAITNLSVVVDVDLNIYRSTRAISVTFISTNGVNTSTLTWTGYQIANPDYYVGRFAGTVVTKTIDANTTRYYLSKQLFAAVADEGTSNSWATVGNFMGATSVIDGKVNTLMLNSIYYPAAYKCYSKGGWYLPAQNQLAAMWITKSVLGPLPGPTYWSSTEANAAAAWFANLTTGDVTTAEKVSPSAVRCVREE